MLHLLLDRPLAKGIVSAEENLPLVVEPVARVERAVRRPVAVGPVIVAGLTIAADFKALKYPSPC
ncbi:hypothetical protein ACMA5K_13565 [Bradyrhizobium diazoefficiens]|uniref:hypothetical protein n=1 Tax=Bradyrhizobium diazoefficiens TaxID=1355477 RepID=UPI0032213B46